MIIFWRLPIVRTPGNVVLVISVGHMKNLADAPCFIAVVLEKLRQSYDIGRMCTNERREIVNLNGLGSLASKQRRARRIA